MKTVGKRLYGRDKARDKERKRQNDEEKSARKHFVSFAITIHGANIIYTVAFYIRP